MPIRCRQQASATRESLVSNPYCSRISSRAPTKRAYRGRGSEGSNRAIWSPAASNFGDSELRGVGAAMPARRLVRLTTPAAKASSEHQPVTNRSLRTSTVCRSSDCPSRAQRSRNSSHCRRSAVCSVDEDVRVNQNLRACGESLQRTVTGILKDSLRLSPLCLRLGDPFHSFRVQIEFDAETLERFECPANTALPSCLREMLLLEQEQLRTAVARRTRLQILGRLLLRSSHRDQMSNDRTLSAFSSINWRRGST